MSRSPICKDSRLVGMEKKMKTMSRSAKSKDDPLGVNRLTNSSHASTQKKKGGSLPFSLPPVNSAGALCREIGRCEIGLEGMLKVV